MNTIQQQLREAAMSQVNEIQSDSAFIDKIDKSTKRIEDFLYRMPDQSFSKVMGQWLKYHGEYNQEALTVFLELEESLRKFDDVLNYDGNPIPHSSYK
tara:strand:+ start:176 stop:469 length:294 start_codon:yes stop_codon:yes gene_type:complete